MIPWLHPLRVDFPPVSEALEAPNGLLAAGGDLSAERILAAYRQGIFPWYNPDEPILWWSPNPRCVLFPDELHVSRSLRKAVRRGDYRLTFDTAFERVIQSCAAPRGDNPDTWISADMEHAYCRLHLLGHAHSVELWREGALIGGLYGIALGGVFFGESMFSTQSNASKIAFVHLVEQLKEWGYAMVDCQVYSDHLASLGAREIPRRQFIDELRTALRLRPDHRWTAEPPFSGRASSP